MFAAGDAGERLFTAIRQGDAAQVTALLDHDPSVARARNADGASAILWAAYTRHPDLIPLFTARGVKLDLFEACASGDLERVRHFIAEAPAQQFSPDGFSALGLAVFFGHAAIARLLVERGADVNAPSRNSILVAPLHSAVAAGSLELVKLLLEHGADADPVEFLGATPLHSAAAMGSVDIIEVLLAHGADTAKRTKDGKTAAELARQYHHLDTIRARIPAFQ